MVKETTIIFMDTSSYMGSRDSSRYLAQLDAMELYIKLILKPHPDHYVGVFGLTLLSFVVEPTNDISDIMTRVRREKIFVGSDTCFERALRCATDPHEDVLNRMVVFIGGPLADPYHSPVFYTPPPTYTMPMYTHHYTQLGAWYKEMGVAVDVINFGTDQEGFKKHHLCVFLAAVNNNNARMLDCPGRHHLDESWFLVLVGKGRRSSESALLMQGDDFQTAKNQFDEVHGDNFHDLKPHEGNDNTRDRKRKPDDKCQDKGRERYGDQGDRYDRKQDDTTNRRFQIGLSVDRKQGDRYDRKRKHDDKGHDEGRETYRDRGDRYGRKRDYRGHDEGRAIYGDRGDRHDRKHDDTTYRCLHIRLSVDISSNSLIREARCHDEGREKYQDLDDWV